MKQEEFVNLNPGFITYFYSNKTGNFKIIPISIKNNRHKLKYAIEFPIFLPRNLNTIKKINSYSLFTEAIEVKKYTKENIVITAKLKILVRYLDEYFKNKLYISKKSIYKLLKNNNYYNHIDPKIEIKEIHLINKSYLIAKISLIID